VVLHRVARDIELIDDLSSRVSGTTSCETHDRESFRGARRLEYDGDPVAAWLNWASTRGARTHAIEGQSVLSFNDAFSPEGRKGEK
jgi:hypothetical protein